MILSTAGSGKTLVLTNRVVRIANELRNQNQKNQRILCLCFNQAMADEMYHRIAQILVDQNVSADICVTRTSYTITKSITIEVRTFHGLGRYILNSATSAQRHLVAVPPAHLHVLQGRALKKGFYDALKSSGRLRPDATEKSARGRLASLLTSIEAIKGKLFDKACENLLLNGTPLEKDTQTQQHNLPEFEIYEKYLYNAGATDYGDMVWKSVQLLLKSQPMRDTLKSRYVAVLVDEFQDMSASQLVLCRSVVDASKSLTLVGDDDQQIYSWRTSNRWFCHKAAGIVFPNIRTLILPENRRCSAAIVRAAFAVISRNPDRAHKPILPVRPDGLPVLIVGCQSLTLEKQFVAKSVKHLLRAARERAGRILILFRINELLLDFQNFLSDSGVHTTRTIRPRANASVIGSLTLSTLALVTLVAPEVDLDTFVWAATTISPKLSERVIQDVLAEQERKENEANEHATGKRTHSHLAKGMTSRYLERLTSWYTGRNDCDDLSDEERVEPMYSLLEHSDTLLLKMRELNSVQEVVRYATKVLSSSDDVQSQQSVLEEGADEFVGTQGGEQGGYDVLIRAAKRVDARSKEKERQEQLRNKQHRVRVLPVAQVEDEGDGSDLEDFSELFTSDAQSSKKKRRKAMGIDNRREVVQRSVKSLGHDVDEFCDTVRMKLGDYSDGRLKHSAPGNGHADETGVVLSTVHNAKGSTFDHVFLCGVNKYDFPNGMLIRGGQGPFQCVLAEGASDDGNSFHCQEERRVFFVALTRAVSQFVCTYSADKPVRETPKEYESMFLSEVFEGLAANNDGKDDVVESFVFQTSDINNILSSNDAFRRSKKSLRAKKEENFLN